MWKFEKLKIMEGLKTTSLKTILKSKLNKNKRQKHIAQMERELGIITDPVKKYSNSGRKIIIGTQDNYTPYQEFKTVISKVMRNMDSVGIKTHYEPLTLELLRGKHLDRESTYKNIEDLLSGYWFTEAGTAKDIHSKYRRYDGTLFLYWDKTEIDLLNCSFQFINECKEKLEYAGFVVNVHGMDEINRICPFVLGAKGIEKVTDN